MRSFLPSLALFVFVAPLAVAACGVGTSQTTGPHPTPHEDAGPGPGPDGGPGPGPDGGCDYTDPSPGPECTDCYGNPVAPFCIGGTWQCPEYGCPIELPDAGCENSPPVPCPSGPIGECAPYWTQQCNGNQWTCVEQFPDCDVVSPPPIFDATPPPDDAGPPPDDATTPPGLFSCGNLGCDPATSYCQITTGGTVGSEDAGSTDFYCIPLPSSCASDTPASCACVQAVQGIGCGCVQAQGEVTVTCLIP
jgi:hypothetical protein